MFIVRKCSSNSNTILSLCNTILSFKTEWKNQVYHKQFTRKKHVGCDIKYLDAPSCLAYAGSFVIYSVRAFLSLRCFGDWWQCFCGLIVCLEFLRRFIARYKTVRCPSKTIEDGIVLHFFLVDLNRRRAVLLRGGPRWKGSGGTITYTFPPLSPPFPWTLELTPVILFVIVLAAIAKLAVVLLPGAVVPQAPAVVATSRACVGFPRRGEDDAAQ